MSISEITALNYINMPLISKWPDCNLNLYVHLRNHCEITALNYINMPLISKWPDKGG